MSLRLKSLTSLSLILYTQYDEHGTAQIFDINVPHTYTQTNGHTQGFAYKGFGYIGLFRK